MSKLYPLQNAQKLKRYVLWKRAHLISNYGTGLFMDTRLRKYSNFRPEHPGKKKLYEESHSKSRYCSWGSIFLGRRWPTADRFQWRPDGRFNIRNGAIWWFHYRRLCRFISKSYIKDIFWQGSIATFTHYHTGAVRWSLLLGINMFTSLVLKKSNGFYFKTTIL